MAGKYTITPKCQIACCKYVLMQDVRISSPIVIRGVQWSATLFEMIYNVIGENGCYCGFELVQLRLWVNLGPNRDWQARFELVQFDGLLVCLKWGWEELRLTYVKINVFISSSLS